MGKVDYLRISVTDRCNERCTYCMPEGLQAWVPRDEILSYEELLRLATVASSIGFRKFRITGGEPLVRLGVASFIESLAQIPGVQDVSLSTNATLLSPLAARLAKAGVRGVNVSLDTLDASAYNKLTGSRLEKCLEGLRAAHETGSLRIKLNSVLVRGVSEGQLLPLARLAAALRTPIRFIELMPLTTSVVLAPQPFFPTLEARERLSKHMTLELMNAEEVPRGHGPAVYYKALWDPEAWDDAAGAVRLAIPGIELEDTESQPSIIGFISPMTDHLFCDSCNKVRITPEGMLRPCLGSHLEFDLRSVLRAGGANEDLRAIFLTALGQKPERHDFPTYTPARRMSAIGG